jgi:flavin reductase ActVB
VSRQDVQDAPDVAGAVTPTAAFREAMKRFASGVTIVTTVDQDGEWKGFTASAFCSVSLDPPLVLVCQARTSTSHAAFARCDRFLINILGAEHQELALRFARSGGDKFTGGEFRPSRTWGLPLLPDALAVVRCEVHARHEGGDHDIYIGEVRSCRVRDGAPVLHFDSRFWALTDSGVGRWD